MITALQQTTRTNNRYLLTIWYRTVVVMIHHTLPCFILHMHLTVIWMRRVPYTRLQSHAFYKCFHVVLIAISEAKAAITCRRDEWPASQRLAPARPNSLSPRAVHSIHVSKTCFYDVLKFEQKLRH